MKPGVKNGSMPFAMAYVLLILLMSGPTAGTLLNWRQAGGTDKSTVIAATAPSESPTTSVSASITASPSGSGSTSSASVTEVLDRPVLASPTSGVTETSSTASTTTASANNATATGNSTLTDSNDPSFCHVQFSPGVEPNPFCAPIAGSEIDVNASYEVTWDASQFVAGSNLTILLYRLDENTTSTIPNNTELLNIEISSELGSAFFNTTSAMLNGSSNATLAFFANTTKDGEPIQYPGPTFYLLNKNSTGHNPTSSSGSSSGSSKQLGEKVGIPVGLIIFLIILAALAFSFFRYRRNSAGYATGKSLGQRTNTGSLRGGGGGGGGGHRRQESFHDEPTTGGVELQDRSRGLTGEDNWEWRRDSVGSPTSPSSGNQFRDELARQKSGRMR